MAKSSPNPGAGAGREPDSEGAAAPAPRPAQQNRPESQALLIVTGSDHPGILDDISHYIADRKAQIEAVRVVSLSGRFALLMQVSGTAEAIRAVEGDLGALMERTGVRVAVEPVHDPRAGLTAGTSFALAASGGSETDESTTLRQTSNLLRVLNINIRDVETRRTAGGGFDMRMKIDVPRDVPVGKLRELLGQLLSQQALQWDLSAAAPE
jgi:predicted amino acid-binding ACT domain protein